MDQEKIGKLIKELRLKDNLTQKDFADKYGVTYQAVSKWENGKNLPDTLLLKQICNDYQIDINSVLDGTITPKKNNYTYIYIIILSIIIVILLFYFTSSYHKKEHTFEFKTISSNCEDFKLNGSIAYNSSKSVIYISNIEYCGNNENEIYSLIEASLYEQENNLKTKIGTINTVINTNLTLKDYLKNVTINVNNNQRLCKNYSNDNLYLEINATKKNNQKITFNIPLKVKDCT